jgi:hypothetical protein
MKARKQTLNKEFSSTSQQQKFASEVRAAEANNTF